MPQKAASSDNDNYVDVAQLIMTNADWWLSYLNVNG